MLQIVVGLKNYEGEWSYVAEKKKKALRLFEKYKENIIDSLSNTRIKHGSKSNMGFRYGDNREIHNSKGKITEIRRYAVDFNGTKELLKRIKV